MKHLIPKPLFTLNKQALQIAFLAQKLFPSKSSPNRSQCSKADRSPLSTSMMFTVSCPRFPCKMSNFDPVIFFPLTQVCSFTFSISVKFENATRGRQAL